MASLGSSSGAPPRVAIIGGGVSGLAAAFRLTELVPQVELAVFEAGDRLGGILDTVSRDGFLLERSADSFQTKLPHALDLCRRLGIDGDLLPTDDARRRALVVRGGQLVPVPRGFFLMSPSRLGPVLTSPVLSLWGKLRLLAEPLIPPRAGTDESIESFATRRLGREAFERLVQPLVSGIYTGDAARLSMAATLPGFRQFERQYGSLLRATLFPHGDRAGTTSAADRSSHDERVTASGARYSLFAAPRSGMAGLVRALVDHLPPAAVRLNTRVTQISRRTDRRWQLDIEPTGSAASSASSDRRSAIDERQAHFDAVVLAVPAHAAARLLRSVDAALAATLDEIEYASCAVVSLACRRSHVGYPLESFGFVVPRVENRRIIAASFASQKFPGRAPDDCALIRVFVGGAFEPELVEWPDDELERLVRDEIAGLLQFTSQPLWVDVARWPQSMPQYHVGHLERVARIEERVAGHPTLALAGNAYHGVGIPQCVRSGEQAAEQIAVSSQC